MNRLKYYVEESQRRFRRRSFLKLAAEVVNVPPAEPSADGPLILSMVQHRDVLPYLVAVKSLTRHMPASGFVVVADKSLTVDDKGLLQNHVRGLVIRDACEFERRGMPVGGTWERLIAISEYAQRSYVVQMDADTMTLGSVDAVAQAWRSRRSFALSTFDLQAKVAVAEVARWARSHCGEDAHVQVLCESHLLEAAGGDESKQYIRGCSGFAGFAPHSFSYADLQLLSERMGRVLQGKWSKWGTEQFASNYIISNSTDSVALPHPVYTTPDCVNKTTAFIHFIGPLRYHKGIYLECLKDFLRGPNERSPMLP